jgi:hypothetical protein
MSVLLTASCPTGTRRTASFIEPLIQNKVMSFQTQEGIRPNLSELPSADDNGLWNIGGIVRK